MAIEADIERRRGQTGGTGSREKGQGDVENEERKSDRGGAATSLHSKMQILYGISGQLWQDLFPVLCLIKIRNVFL